MSDQTDTEDQRRGQRIQVAFDALYSNGRKDGEGRLVNFSYSGALIDGASLLPDVGATVRVYIFVQPVAPFEIVGEVVRHSGDQSFALEFNDLSPEMRALVDDAAAVVAAAT